ncbi:MAG: penicillin-binding protein 1C [Anaerolineales bacterium]
MPSHLNQTSIRITDRNGQLLYDVLPENGGRNIVLAFEDIPQCMKDATVAVEDENFYSNPGVDIKGIFRALWINLKGGETLAGGSTITQQVARTLLLSHDERVERSLRRKLRESILAWELTRVYSKNEILALYLNQIYYGGMAYGVEAASQTYFGKTSSDLILPECALLAGLTQTPGLYNPFTNPDLAINRERVVLGLMEKHGYINEQERLAAEVTPLNFNPAPYPIEAPHFVWLIKDELDAMFLNGELNPHDSLVVRTTLDLNIQKNVESIVVHQIQWFKMTEGNISHNVNNGAVVVMKPASGDVLALVGSADYFDAKIRGALNMAISPRQTGSAFKPFIYASALDPQQAEPWTVGTPILDVYTTFITNNNVSYTPINYDGTQHGYVTVRDALASSLNIPAVKTLQKVTIERAIEIAKRLGITTLNDPDRYDLSLALGGGEVSLLELTNAYAALADEGNYVEHRLILDVHTADGKLAFTQSQGTPVQVIDPRVAWLISDVLSDDHARSRAFGLNSTLKLDRVAAVKTGTTTNYHDNWTIGYTPDLVVGVWVGNSTYEAMRNVTGLTGAAPIWHDAMRTILEGQPEQTFVRPDGLREVKVCEMSGLLPTEFCAHTKSEWFIEGTEPLTPDTFYKQIWVDAFTNQLATDVTPIEHRQSIIVLDLPLEAQLWAHEQGLSLISDYSEASANLENDLVMISPVPSSVYRIYSKLDPSAQQISIEAISGQGFSDVTLWVDGRIISSFSIPPYQAWWKLSIGEHRFWAEGNDKSGNHIKTAEISITVLNGQ